MGFVLLLTVSQDALTLLRHLQADPGAEAPADKPALRAAPKWDFHHAPGFETFPAQSKGRGASERAADEEPEGMWMLYQEQPGWHTPPQHKHQSGTLKPTYLLRDLFRVQVKELHFLLMKQVTEKQ